MSVTLNQYPKKSQVLKLVKNINKSKKRIKKMMYPLEVSDDGWRLVFPASLPEYQFLPSGRKLLQMSRYGIDFEGGYYVIQYAPRP